MTAQEFVETNGVLTTEEGLQTTQRRIVNAALDAGYYPVMISSFDGLITFLCSEFQTLAQPSEVISQQARDSSYEKIATLYDQMFDIFYAVLHNIQVKKFWMKYEVDAYGELRYSRIFLCFTPSRQDATQIASEIAARFAAEQAPKDADKMLLRRASDRVRESYGL